MKSNMVKVTAEDRNRLFRMAFTKSAQAPAAEGQDNKDNTVAGAAIGALLGTGLGYLNYRMTPKDVDEDSRKKLLRHLLSGAALGGVAGAGIGYYKAIPRAVDAVKSLVNSEPVTNKEIGKNFGKSIDRSPPGRALAGGLGGRYVVGPSIGFLGDLVQDRPWAAALLDRRGTRSFADALGVEHNQFHEWGPRLTALREVNSGTFQMDPIIQNVYDLRKQYPGNLRSLPTSAEADITSRLNSWNLLPPGTSSADAMRIFDDLSRTASGVQARANKDPNFVQDLFSRRGRYNKLGSKTLAALMAILGWFSGGGNAGVDTTTPAGNRQGK